MLYDLGRIPPSGSLLESIFKMITNRRHYTEFLKTRVIVDALLAPHSDGGMDILKETFERLTKMALPYLDKAKSAKNEQQKALEQWTNRGPLAVRPLWRAKEGARGTWKSSLQRSAEKRIELEKARRLGHLRRIG